MATKNPKKNLKRGREGPKAVPPAKRAARVTKPSKPVDEPTVSVESATTELSDNFESSLEKDIDSDGCLSDAGEDVDVMRDVISSDDHDEDSEDERDASSSSFSSDSEDAVETEPLKGRLFPEGQDVDVDFVLNRVLAPLEAGKKISPKLLSAAVQRLTDCWISNDGIVCGPKESSKSVEEAEVRLTAFVAIRKLLDAAGGLDEAGNIIPGRQPNKPLVTRLLRRLVNKVSELVSGSRLHWHRHKTVGFLTVSIVHLITRHIPTGVAYLMVYETLRDLADAVQAPKVLHGKPLPRKRKALNVRKDKLTKLEGKVFNWSFMIKLRIILRVFSEVRRVVDASPENTAETKQHDELLLLCYPYYCALSAAMNLKWGKAGYIAFNCQMMRLMTELQYSVKSFVPLGMLIIQLMTQLINLALSSKFEKDTLGKDRKVAFTALRLSASHCKDATVIDDLWKHFVVTVYHYAAALAHHPSYPETMSVIGLAMRRAQAPAPAKAAGRTSKTPPPTIPTTYSRQLSQFIKVSKESGDKIAQLRDNLELEKVESDSMFVLKGKTIAIHREWQKLNQLEQEALRAAMESTD